MSVEISRKMSLNAGSAKLQEARASGIMDELKLEQGLMNKLMKKNDGAFSDMPFFTPSTFIYHDPHHNVDVEYQLTFLQRLFVMLEIHDSSMMAMFCASLVTSCIIIGCVCFILAEEPEFLAYHPYTCLSDYDMVCDHKYSANFTYLPVPSLDGHRRLGSSSSGSTEYSTIIDPDSQYCPDRDVCKPHHDITLELIESICMFIFTLEYLTLLITVPSAPSRLAHTMPHEWDDEHHFHKPDPVLPFYIQMPKFFLTWKMLIDVATLLPFYILIDSNPVFFPHNPGGNNFNFIRVFRLLRILHIFKISRKNQILSLVERTMKLSMPTMILTGYLTCIHMVFWGSLVHFFEQGEWRAGATLESYHMYPDGTYMRKNWADNSWEPSPFNSIAVGIYWVIMMSTSTGVGARLQPTTKGGRACAVFVTCIGVILMAIPIGVVGLNFAQEWEKMKVLFFEQDMEGPKRHIKMFTTHVKAIHVKADAADDDEGDEVVIVELTEAEKYSEEVKMLATNFSNGMEQIVDGQRTLALTHDKITELLNKLHSKMSKEVPKMVGHAHA